MELCGIPTPQTLLLDGISFAPLLEGNDSGWPDRMIFSHQNRFGETQPTPGTVRTSKYRLVNYGKGYELYDMLADPGQKIDVASQFPETTERLAQAYESWFSKVTTAGISPPPLPVGYQPEKTTALQGEDARLSAQLKFYRGKGWAHDSIRNWLNPQEDHVTWEMDIKTAGRYEVILMYGCLEEDVGSCLEVRVARQVKQSIIEIAHESLPVSEKARNRNSIWTSGPVPGMSWKPLSVGVFDLKAGTGQLNVRMSVAKGQSFELKEARLRWTGP
jgi:hypothetical protein